MYTHNAVSYAHMGAWIEDTAVRSTITRFIIDWPSGLSDLPCGLRPPRRPSRVMVEPVAGFTGIGLGVTPLGQRGCGWAAPSFVKQRLWYQ